MGILWKISNSNEKIAILLRFHERTIIILKSLKTLLFEILKFYREDILSIRLTLTPIKNIFEIFRDMDDIACWRSHRWKKIHEVGL